MKQPSAPPLEFEPPPAYSTTKAPVKAYVELKGEFCNGFFDPRKCAFIISITGICISFLFLFIFFFGGIVLLGVCIMSAYAYYKENPFFYIPPICFLLINCFFLTVLTVSAIVGTFMPELVTAYASYLPDIVREYYRYFAIFCMIICISITTFCLLITEVFYKAFRATQPNVKQPKLIDPTTV